MISLARANLIHDWRRHSTAIFVLVLAGLLMTIQLGFVVGYIKTFGLIKQQITADVVIATQSHYRAQPIDTRYESSIWMHPQVEMVSGWSSFGAMAQWQKIEENTISSSNSRPPIIRVMLIAVDPSQHSMSFPKQFPESFRALLSTPGTVILSRSAAKLLSASVGEKVTIDNIEIIVGAIFDGLPTPQLPNVFTSEQTLRLISDRERDISAYLVKVKNPQLIQQTIAELNLMLSGKNLIATTVEGFSKNNSISDIFQGPGKILLGSAAFALLVGCGIASQTLRGAFLAQIKEFGSLRALGIRRRVLAGIAMEQAFWIGIASIPLSFIIAHLIRIVSKRFDIIIDLPVYLMAASSALLLVVALFAGLFSLTVIFKAEPAELLR